MKYYWKFIIRKVQTFKFKGRSCVFIGLISLTLQFVLFLLLLYTLEENNNPTRTTSSCSTNFCKDLKCITIAGLEIGVHFIILERDILQFHKKQKRNLTTNCYYCPLFSPVVLGIDSVAVLLEKKSQFLRKLIDEDFVPVTFYNRHPVQTIPELDQVEISLLFQRTTIFQIVILHPREDNTWWYGDIHSDLSYEAKLSSLNLTLDNITFQKSEGAIERFEAVPSEENPYLMFPKNINSYLAEIDHATFIECNVTRAQEFLKKFETDLSAEAVRFKHKVWKMLSKVKTILESLNIPFWLSSGTALGYFRECDIIAHSKDVDIGIFALSYSNKIITEMQNHGFQLKISLGFPNDSFELSFLDQSGVKLDIFFFYEDEHSYWNGGTQVKSGKKFKYSFPKFTLCWTLFKDLKLRVPCETETYIQANYGPHWFTPVKSWDWKTSPFNVQPNGVWKTDQLAKAVKIFV